LVPVGKIALYTSTKPLRLPSFLFLLIYRSHVILTFDTVQPELLSTALQNISISPATRNCQHIWRLGWPVLGHIQPTIQWVSGL